jgi:hypothetical protein
VNVIRVAKSFNKSIHRANLSPDMRKALGACIRAISSAPDLPGPKDFRVCVPPVSLEWVRCVAGTGGGLWLYYDVDSSGVTHLTRVSRNTPNRLDP